MNPSGIKPINGYVVIKPEGGEAKSAGGIILPEDAVEKAKYGSQSGAVIIAAEDVKYGITEGQRVLFGRHAGTMVKGVDGNDYRLCQDEDVKGIFCA